MKKLLIVMCCISAITLMSSCTTDSIEDFKNTTNKNISKVVIDSIGRLNSIDLGIGDIDKDKTKT
ncbi:hypothetical protein [Flavobacterium sp.]|uniref:hypothetical protein n=1 Tax=Flavobacterium sp. TaxID=239 RepID=UPI0025D29816|nr:hypothetical protein [Flavobacterium sp.]